MTVEGWIKKGQRWIIVRYGWVKGVNADFKVK